MRPRRFPPATSPSHLHPRRQRRHHDAAPSAFTINLFLTVPPAAPTNVVNVAAVTRPGSPAPGYNQHRRGDYDRSSAAVSAGIASCSPGAAAADVCWVGADRGEPVGRWRSQEEEPVPSHLRHPLGTLCAAANPALWALELADGASKCRLRNGGARGGRADNYVGDYSCDRSDEVVLVKDDQYQAVTKSGPVWTVLVGHLGNADEVFPAPKKVRVVTAYFATAP